MSAAPALAAGSSVASGSIANPYSLTPEEACNTIHHALHGLASAEGEEAFALKLESGKGDATAIVEARLTRVLDSSNALRTALEQVRRHAAPHDPRVEQCKQIGFWALAEAERLTANVEEVLYGDELSADTRPESDVSLPRQ
ncbi:MAG TPA: hypothetical protein VEJ86_02295 [Candidatus Binataceae bacterium]|nr:hypothetical protein [Candidatus Binataceae bacterium]